MRLLVPLLVLVHVGCGAPRATIVVEVHEEEPDAGPPLDRDHDGLVESEDVCPCDAEDVDGFEDHDGCPDPDDDGDHVVDVCDLCPRQPETYNGVCDGDGCPDAGYVCVSIGAIRIMEQIYFRRNSSTIDPPALPIVDAIAQALNENPQLTLVAIVGEAEPRERRHDALALARAQAIVEALVERGVVRERLAAEADTTPEHGDDETPDHWRRVRFEIRVVAGEPVDPAAGLEPGCAPRRGGGDCPATVCNPPEPVPSAC